MAINIIKFLNAIQVVETEHGRNNWPRIEPAYLPKDSRFTIQGRILKGTGVAWNAIVEERYKKWGLASAASWGSWQILYHTAVDRGYKGVPWMLMSDVISRPVVADHLKYLMSRGATTVEALADAWNSGTHTDRIVPHDYMKKVLAAYES